MSQQRCECGRAVVFRSPKTGRVRSGENHTLCPRCWRDSRNATRHKGLPMNPFRHKMHPKKKPRIDPALPVIRGEDDDGDGS